MKKTLIALVLSCAALLAARDIRVNLNGAKLGADKIPGWMLNRSGKSADFGKGEVVAGSESDKKAFKMKAPANRHVAFYTVNAYPVKVGEKLEISADVKGKGTITVGYYAYGEKGRNITAAPGSSKTFKLTDKKTEIECEIPLDAPKSGKLLTIRPFISVAAGGEAVVEDIEIEIDND